MSHCLPIYSFLLVLDLFCGNHMSVEMLLKALVSEVDAELFEAVGMEFGDSIGEDFESKDV